jgi:YHS domain-containing protein
MKRIVLTALVLFGFTGAGLVSWPGAGATVAAWARSTASAQAGRAAAPDKPGAKTPATGPASKPAGPINKFCPVETENPVDPTVPTVVYDGKIIGFCCDDCPAKFKKNPKAYMKGLK